MKNNNKKMPKHIAIVMDPPSLRLWQGERIILGGNCD